MRNYITKNIVFPTLVGMIPSIAGLALESWSVPHARGDDPTVLPEHLGKLACSPRSWG